MGVETERAWAAGFFDGEGSTWVGSGGRHTNARYLSIEVGQNGRELLERFQAAIGCAGWVRGPYGNNHYKFALKGLKAVGALGQLWPYLGEVKKQQAIDAANACSLLVGKGRKL